jgi:hypothetical protein
MEYLDHDEHVSTWSYESLSIDYVSNKKTGKTRRYIPDFCVEFLDGHTEIIEIKPSRRLKTLVVKKKAEAARAWCGAHGLTYVILTENELKVIGLL